MCLCWCAVSSFFLYDSVSCFIEVAVDGELYSFGANSHGECGVGHRNLVDVPTLVGARAERERETERIFYLFGPS